MNQDLPPGLADDEIQEFTQIVAESLAKGEDPQTVAQTLVDSGWEPDQANAFVGSVHQHLLQQQSGGGGGASESMGWLIWLGALVGINLLSWIFNWGFWLY